MNQPSTLYELFYQVMRLHFKTAHILFEKIGLYPGQPVLLFTLNKKDGQSQKELAKALNIKPATITVMIKRMSKAGLIEKKQNENDKRQSQIYLTEKGKEIVKHVDEIVQRINNQCFSNLTKEEEEILRQLFCKIKNNLIEIIQTETKGKSINCFCEISAIEKDFRSVKEC